MKRRMEWWRRRNGKGRMCWRRIRRKEKTGQEANDFVREIIQTIRLKRSRRRNNIMVT